MGFFDDVGGLLGLGGQGSNWQAQGITPEQLNASMAQTQGAYGQQQNLANQLAAQGAQGMGSQTALTQALMQQMQGGGPNPAQMALANATGANVANQAALMAGQRGASANAGLMARQAAQQGAGIQQQAAGQGALMQAQQQLAAQNALQNLAQTQIGQQTGAVGNLNQYALSNQGQQMGMMGSQNAANQAMQAAGMKQGGSLIGGLINAAGGALAGPVGALAANMFTSKPAASSGGSSGGSMGGQRNFGLNLNYAQGGEVQSDFNALHELYHGGPYQPKMMEGGEVPGEPKVNYNTPKNDTVVAKLTPKEIVLPLSVTQSDDPANEAAKFVAAIMAKKGNPKMEENEFKSALKEAIKSRKK